MNCSTSGFPILHHPLELAQTHVHWIVDAIQPSYVIPFSSYLQSFLASESFIMNQFFVSGSQSIGACLIIRPSNEYSGLISFRIDWFDLLAVQGTPKSFFQHHSSRVWVLLCPAFLMVQLSHPNMTTGKTIALTIWTFVGKVKSQVIKAVFRFVITFLPRRRHLLISWLQSPSAVILEPKKINSVTIFIVFPSICHKVMGTDAVM